MPGAFITFEGGDGVGKTTQAQLLEEWLKKSGRKVLRTREPGGSPLGVKIREILLHSKEEVNPKAEALLYAADRAQHVETVVKPALAEGKIVVQDRYIDSSLAYQGAGRVLTVAEVQNLNIWATAGLWPDLTILLDLDPAVAGQRMKKRGALSDRIENEALEFHSAVQKEFVRIAANNPNRFLVCDANKPVIDIANKIRDRVQKQIF